MPPALKKAAPLPLRSLGVDEKWLQGQIEKDPTLLGLGELEIVSREHRQPVGGRIDFLMRNVEGDTFYEVELMLGAIDESHIIRTIEYWDIERQRRPSFDHRAVIAAEEITSRFFNVLRLLNRAVPLTAIKLSALQIGDEVYLHPVTVLDVIDEVIDDSVDPIERSDRSQWEKKSPSTLAVLDFLVDGIRGAGIEPRVTYNRNHLAIGSTGRNFFWLHARKPPRCHIEIRVGSDRDNLSSQLQDGGVDVISKGTDYLAFATTIEDMEKNSENVLDALKKAEAESR